MRTYRGHGICNPGVVVNAQDPVKVLPLKLALIVKHLFLEKLSYIFKMFLVIGTSS